MRAFSRRTQAVLENIECVFKLYAYTYRINLGRSNDPFGVWLDIHDHIRQLVYLCHKRSGLFLGRNQEGPANVSSCITTFKYFHLQSRHGAIQFNPIHALLGLLLYWCALNRAIATY